MVCITSCRPCSTQPSLSSPFSLPPWSLQPTTAVPLFLSVWLPAMLQRASGQSPVPWFGWFLSCLWSTILSWYTSLQSLPLRSISSQILSSQVQTNACCCLQDTSVNVYCILCPCAPCVLTCHFWHIHYYSFIHHSVFHVFVYTDSCTHLTRIWQVESLNANVQSYAAVSTIRTCTGTKAA